LTLDDSRGRDLERMAQNLIEVKPTVYFSVPRVYNALVARAQKDRKVAGALRGCASPSAPPLPSASPRFPGSRRTAFRCWKGGV